MTKKKCEACEALAPRSAEKTLQKWRCAQCNRENLAKAVECSFCDTPRTESLPTINNQPAEVSIKPTVQETPNNVQLKEPAKEEPQKFETSTANRSKNDENVKCSVTTEKLTVKNDIPKVKSDDEEMMMIEGT